MTSRLCLNLCPLLAASLPASTILEDVPDSAYRSRAQAFDSVGEVSGSGLSGSGVYLGDGWVLTAGHIAAGKNSNSTFTLGDNDFGVTQSILHPGWNFGSDANDLGLIQLSTNLLGSSGSPVLVFDDDSSLFGQNVDWVGYGQSGTGLTGASGSPGILRAFSNIVDAFGPSVGLTDTSFLSDFDAPTGLENPLDEFAPSGAFPTDFEGNVTPGDSGGGVFLDGQLVGIASFQAQFDGSQNSGYGDLSGATRLSLHEDWIFEVSGIRAIPEPSGGLLALLSLGTLVFRRARV
jgi:hypothetical protein